MQSKETGFAGYGYVSVTDDSVFTQDRLMYWRDHLIFSYESILRVLKKKIRSDCHFTFFISPTLLDEAIIDATIGMKKITSSNNNEIEDPNAFKEAAYLAYWWLRHKPVSIHHEEGGSLNEVYLSNEKDLDEEQIEFERSKLAWDLKHINELVAIQIALTYIFDFEKQICPDKRCRKVFSEKGDSSPYKSFDDMRSDAMNTLKYYFAYRTLAPKVIEQLLEAYAFHPAWELTGDIWKVDDE